MKSFKKIVVASVVCLVLAGGAYANGSENGHNNGNGHNKNTSMGIGVGIAGAAAAAKSNSRANARANSYNTNFNSNIAKGGSARQGQLQGQLQGQVTDQANAQMMTYNEAAGMHYSGSYELKNVPDAFAAPIQPTGPCAIPLTGAGSGVGFGISLGTAYVDKECEMREAVRLGLAGDAVSQSLANQVLQTRLRSYVDEDKVAAEIKASTTADVAENDLWYFQNL